MCLKGYTGKKLKVAILQFFIKVLIIYNRNHCTDIPFTKFKKLLDHIWMEKTFLSIQFSSIQGIDVLLMSFLITNVIYKN